MHCACEVAKRRVVEGKRFAQLYRGRHLPPLGPGKHDVQKLLARGHSGDVLPLGLHFGGCGVLMSSKAVCALERLQGKKVHDAIDTGGENRRLAAALVPHPLLASFVRAVATIHHAPDNTIAHIFTIMFSKSRSTFEPQGSALSCGRQNSTTLGVTYNYEHMYASAQLVLTAGLFPGQWHFERLMARAMSSVSVFPASDPALTPSNMFR